MLRDSYCSFPLSGLISLSGCCTLHCVCDERILKCPGHYTYTERMSLKAFLTQVFSLNEVHRDICVQRQGAKYWPWYL